MTFSADDNLFLIGAKGEISEVRAKSDEFRGKIEIEDPTGRFSGEYSIIHLCRTMRAANIVSNNRKVMYGSV